MLNPRLLALTFLFLCQTITAQAQMPTPTVDVAHPLEREIIEYYEYTGRFRAIHEVDLRARVSGYLQEIRFDDGQAVKKDDVLFVIDKRPYEASVKQAEANLKKAEAEKSLAVLEVERGESLLKRNNISTDEVDRRRADLAGAEATVESAKAQLTAAKLELEFTEVKAPFDGRVSDRQVDVGTLISGGSSSATFLVTMISSGPVHFYFDAPEADYLHFIRLDRAGARVSARYEAKKVAAKLSDEEGWPHKGILDFVDVKIATNSGTIRAHAVFENPDNLLLPGYFGRLQLPARGPHKVIMVPDTAILSDQSSKLVYVIDGNNMAQIRSVTLGPIVDGLRVIRSGLTVADTLITNGIMRVRPGTKINPTVTEITATEITVP